MQLELGGKLAGLVGARSPVAVLAAGASIVVIVLCFAEVGSRFDAAGGPYLYVREALGPALGFHVGWLHIWTRLLSAAAVLNVLTSYLERLLPGVGTSADDLTLEQNRMENWTGCNSVGAPFACTADDRGPDDHGNAQAMTLGRRAGRRTRPRAPSRRGAAP